MLNDMLKIAKDPIDLDALKNRQLSKENFTLGAIAKKNPEFNLSAFQTIHKAKLNERLLKTLYRSDIDRPKILNKKHDIFCKYEDHLESLPIVKRTMRQELQNYKDQRLKEDH